MAAGDTYFPMPIGGSAMSGVPAVDPEYAAAVVGAGDPYKQAVGNPSLLDITGAGAVGAWVYYPIADFTALSMRAGDSLEINAIWTYTSSTNNKLLSLAYGPSEASVTQITSSTRAVAGEVTFVMRAELWADTNTSMIAHTSILTPYANSTNALGTFSIDLSANPMKLFLRAQLALASETISIRSYRTKLNRGK